MIKKFNPVVDYEADIILIGVSCHLKDYRLVHYLNKDYHINLTRCDDFVFLKEYDKETEKYLPQYFPFYYYFSEEDYISYNFIVNRTLKGILLNEYKQIDFIIIINGAIDNFDVNPFINFIKQITNVQTVVELKFDLIKNIKPILEDLEFHITVLNRKDEEENDLKKKRILKQRN